MNRQFDFEAGSVEIYPGGSQESFEWRQEEKESVAWQAAARFANAIRKQGFLARKHFIDRIAERGLSAGIRFDPRTFRREFFNARHYKQTRPGYNTRIAVVRDIPILYRVGGWRGKHIVLAGALPEGALPPGERINPPPQRETETALIAAEVPLELYEMSGSSIPSRKDLIDERIDFYAQEALYRMFKGDPGARADASGMFAAVKAGQLAGIYIVNQYVPAMRARKMNTWWWLLIPKGEDAILQLDPAALMAGPPLIAFRGSAKSDPSSLDPALRKAWSSFQLLQSGEIVHCDLPPGPVSTEAEVFPSSRAIANIIPPFCAQPRVPTPKPSPKPRPRPAKPTGRDELVSWCHPYSPSVLIGQIYFETNSAILGADDTAALDRLVATFNEFGDLFRGDPIGILFLGHADFRSTTFPGGNQALSDDRASTCHDYFVTHLTNAARESVEIRSEGKGVDPKLVRGLQALGVKREKILKRMRMTAIMRPFQPPIIRPRKPIPPKDCAAAHARGRDVLRSFAGMFTSEELRHLTHLCKDETVRDAFLNGMDPELQKITGGLGGRMTDAEAEAFANRFHACDDLMMPFSTGPNADDLDVVGALKGLHSRIEQGIDLLTIAAAREDITGFVNERRAKLSAFVLREAQNPKSLYFRWF